MGLLITIEGGDFVGKSSIVAPFLKELFIAIGIEVIVSREPGGTPEGERLRQLIFRRLKEGAPTEELALLLNEARKIHLENIVFPFLGKKKEKNRVVILDRYLDSTRIYQGVFGGMPFEEIRKLEKKYVKNYFPDYTLIMYFPEKVFKQTFLERQRIAENEVNNRDKTVWDQEHIDTHLEKQRAYLKLPEVSKKCGEKREFFLINAAQTPEKVKEEVKKKFFLHLIPHKNINIPIRSLKKSVD